jgi:hypothetical protein
MMSMMCRTNSKMLLQRYARGLIKDGHGKSRKSEHWKVTTEDHPLLMNHVYKVRGGVSIRLAKAGLVPLFMAKVVAVCVTIHSIL